MARSQQAKSFSLAAIAIALIFLLLPVISHGQPYVRIEDRNAQIQVLEHSDGEIVASITGDNGLLLKHLDTSKIVIQDSNGVRARIISSKLAPVKTLQPVSISFVVDNSGSMFSSYDSLTRYLDKLLYSLPGSFVGSVYTFDHFNRRVSHEPTRLKDVWIATSGLTEDKDSLSRFWHWYDSIRSDFTPLYDQMAAALWNIQMRRDRGDTNALDVLIVISDGKDNASRTSRQTIHDLVRATGVRLYSISYRTFEPELGAFIKRGGGRSTYANNLMALQESVLSLRQQLGYAHRIRYAFPTTRGPGYAKAAPRDGMDWKYQRN